MKKPALLLVLLLWVGLIGCRADERPTPTPFPTPLPQAALPGAPQLAGGIPTTLADLLDNPEFFAGALVQVSGQFGRLPRLVCGQLPLHDSPATWTLRDGEAMVQGGGFDEPLRELFPDDLTLTVVGRWQQWRGPVGCGKEAVVAEFYYLEVVRLLSPSQLVRVTLTPGEPPPPPPEELAPGTPTAVFDPTLPELPEPTAVTPGNGTASPPPPLPGELSGTLTPSPTPTRSDNGGDDDALDDNDSNTPTPPLPGGTPAPTLTPSNKEDDTGGAPPIPGLTPTAPALERGRLVEYDARNDAWAAGEAHNWRVSLQAGVPITVSLIAEPEINSAIRLFSPTGQIVQNQNSAPAGQVESMVLNVSSSGEYTIQLYASDNRAGQYYFSLWDERGITRPMGNLMPGVFRSAEISDSLIHVWFFVGQAGRLATLQTTSSESDPLGIALFDPEQNVLITEQGAIRNYQLPLTGWYSVELEEVFSDGADYQIMLTLQ